MAPLLGFLGIGGATATAGMSLGTKLLLAGLGVSTVGTLYQGVSAQRSGQYNAAVAREEAKTEKVLTDIEIQKHRRAVSKLKGSQIARYGASGVTLEGSPLLVMADTAAEAELDEALIKYGGAATSRALESEAYLAKQHGRESLYGSGLKAGATLLTGYGKYKLG